MTRFGAAMRRIDVRQPGVDLPLLSVSQTRGVLRQSELSDRPPRADSLDAYKLCRRGDVVFNKMSIRSGAMGVAQESGLVTYHYEVMRPIGETDSRFIVYLMKSDQFTGELISRERGIGAGGSAGVRTTEVPFSALRTIEIDMPLASGQKAIADYLDAQTVKIDALIGKQEQLVETLAERRQAVISHAVTKGLDPSSPMKDSGDDWLGSVPEPWTVLKLGRATDVLTGFPFKSDEYSHDDSDVRLLRGINVTPGRLVWAEVVYWPAQDAFEFAKYMLKEGDLVLGLDRPIVSAGTRLARVSAADMPALLLQRVARIRALTGANASFLTYVLSGPEFRNYLAPIFTGVSVPHMSPDQLTAFRIALPALDEQHKIVAYLDDESSKIDALSGKAREMIGVLKERRQALISAAVAGKIDVGGLV